MFERAVQVKKGSQMKKKPIYKSFKFLTRVRKKACAVLKQRLKGEHQERKIYLLNALVLNDNKKCSENEL